MGQVYLGTGYHFIGLISGQITDGDLFGDPFYCKHIYCSRTTVSEQMRNQTKWNTGNMKFLYDSYAILQSLCALIARFRTNLKLQADQ